MDLSRAEAVPGEDRIECGETGRARMHRVLGGFNVSLELKILESMPGI